MLPGSSGSEEEEKTGRGRGCSVPRIPHSSPFPLPPARTALPSPFRLPPRVALCALRLGSCPSVAAARGKILSSSETRLAETTRKEKTRTRRGVVGTEPQVASGGTSPGTLPPGCGRGARSLLRESWTCARPLAGSRLSPSRPDQLLAPPQPRCAPAKLEGASAGEALGCSLPGGNTIRVPSLAAPKLGTGPCSHLSTSPHPPTHPAPPPCRVSFSWF